MRNDTVPAAWLPFLRRRRGRVASPVAEGRMRAPGRGANINRRIGCALQSDRPFIRPRLVGTFSRRSSAGEGEPIAAARRAIPGRPSCV